MRSLFKQHPTQLASPNLERHCLFQCRRGLVPNSMMQWGFLGECS